MKYLFLFSMLFLSTFTFAQNEWPIDCDALTYEQGLSVGCQLGLDAAERGITIQGGYWNTEAAMHRYLLARVTLDKYAACAEYTAGLKAGFAQCAAKENFQNNLAGGVPGGSPFPGGDCIWDPVIRGWVCK